MAERNFTTDQKNAIEARGGSVLVGAAAGSGKTAVLVERIIRRVTDERDPCDIDELLVVTFSRASAAEMKARIAAALAALSEKEPANRRLKRQLYRLQSASIGTIHSFCLDFLTEHFGALSLPQDFRVAEEAQAQLLKAECAALVIERFYKEDADGSFSRLSLLVSSGRDDHRLCETLIGCYDNMMAEAFPDRFLNEMEARCETAAFHGSPFEKAALSQVADALSAAGALLFAALPLCGSVPEFEAGYGPNIAAAKRLFEELLAVCEGGAFDEVQAAVSSAVFPAIGRAKNGVDDRLKEKIRALYDGAKQQFLSLRDGVCAYTAAEAEADLRRTAPFVKSLCALVRTFKNEYTERKREQGLVDFSDLEQLTLSLLVTEDGYTKQAENAAMRYKEIYIDEYQDTNRAQDLIFSAVSRNEENLFFVGDVKQSIYSFRRAEPAIFLEKLKIAAPYGQGVFPAAVHLKENFRSSGPVIRFVNGLFSALMSEGMGGVDYGEKERLIPGRPVQEGALCGASLLAVEAVDGEDGFACEMRAVGEKLLALKASGAFIEEEGVLRPFRMGDAAILLRTVKKKAAAAVKILAEMGVPAVTAEGADLLSLPEVSALVCLLRTINNPLNDVALVGALLSYLYGGTPDDAAALGGKKDTPFYLSLAGRNSPAAMELQADLIRYRSLSAVMPAAELLDLIVEERLVSTRLSALSAPARRRQNVNLFLEFARDRRVQGAVRLSQLVSLLDRMQRGGAKLPCAPVQDADGQAVSILSVHKSKGLEFPVCFVCDLDKRYNLQDLNEKTLLDRTLGFVTAAVDFDTMVKRLPLPYLTVRERLKKQALSEELRVLYVALTRARQQLYVTFKVKDASTAFSSFAAAPTDEEGRLPPAVVASFSNMADVILSALQQFQDIQRLGILTDCEALWEGCTAEVMRPTAAAPAKTGEATEFLPDEAEAGRMAVAMSARYPFEAAAGIPSKLSVSELAKEWDALKGFDERPDFMKSGKTTALDRGNATHRVMELCDMNALRNDPPAEADRLVADGLLTKMERHDVSEKDLLAFAQSPLCGRMANAETLLREYSFLCGIPASLILDTVSEEAVVVQGVLDCLFVGADGRAVLVDYKTDRADEVAIIERYEKQLHLYRYAVEKELHLQVKETVIWSFHLKKEIVLPA